MLHLLMAGVLYLSGDYNPPANNGDTPVSTVCGPGTEPVNAGGTTVCISAPDVQQASPPVIVQSAPTVLVPTGYPYGGAFGGFGFRHFRR